MLALGIATITSYGSWLHSFGATSPLQTIYARTLFDARDLCILMGLQGVAVGVAGGLGPPLGGLMNELTGSWTPTVLLAVTALALSTLLLGNGSKLP